MRHTESLSDAERTALNVFHDLELAHTRQHDEAPRPTTARPDRAPATAQRPTGPASPDVTESA